MENICGDGTNLVAGHAKETKKVIDQNYRNQSQKNENTNRTLAETLSLIWEIRACTGSNNSLF